MSKKSKSGSVEKAITLPRRLKIGAHWYQIKFPYNFIEDYNAYGSHNSVMNHILLGNDDGNGNPPPASTVIQWLIHEILHAFERVTKRDIFPDKDKTADLMAEVILAFLVDNGFLKIDENTVIIE